MKVRDKEQPGLPTSRAELMDHARTGQLALPDAIKAMRRATGLKQAPFAKMFGLTVRQLSELENGRANPTLATLDRIGRAFNFTVGFVPAPAPTAVRRAPESRDPIPAPPDYEVNQDW